MSARARASPFVFPQQPLILKCPITLHCISDRPPPPPPSRMDSPTRRRFNGPDSPHQAALEDIERLQEHFKENLKELDARIQERAKKVIGAATFSDDHTVDEVALLEEDKFWRQEIFSKLQESTDELVARKLVTSMKADILKESTNSTPARKDAQYALELYETERAFELATRRRLDHDEDSRRVAAQLNGEKE